MTTKKMMTREILLRRNNTSPSIKAITIRMTRKRTMRTTSMG